MDRTDPTVDFDLAFEALTGYRPLAWQRRLFRQFLNGQLPDTIDLPTGLGKTSVVPIWLVALAVQAVSGAVSLPRRLVYIVNRRTVVDQATAVVERMRQRLCDPGSAAAAPRAGVLRALASALRGLAAFDNGNPLAVSTLRGELADAGEWKLDPARPAVIVGTIDMIGSKLLFSGYGDGKSLRALHAGLIGQDVLVVHDESHLTPAFSELLRGVEAIQSCGAAGVQRCPRPVRVVELSATERADVTAAARFELDSADHADPVVVQRVNAEKRMRLLSLDERNAQPELIAKLACSHEPEAARILVYVRTPQLAQKVVAVVRKQLGRGAEGRLALLTGTVRGFERDRLVRENPVLRAMLEPNGHAERSVYLVSTSAGEVGIDLDADHMVCDLTTLDALIQRLGRVNRTGGAGRRAEVNVVLEPPDEPSKRTPVGDALDATREILVAWVREDGGTEADVCPAALMRKLAAVDPRQRERAYAPRPATIPLTDIVLDAWSLTSIDRRMPGRPEVVRYLHGMTEGEPPETFVVWRTEVGLLDKDSVDASALGRWFRRCAIRSQERLRDRTDVVHKWLRDLCQRWRKRPDGSHVVQRRAVLIDERGNAAWHRLTELAGDAGRDLLAYRTLVMPVEAGGLSAEGVLDAGALPAERSATVEGEVSSAGAGSDETAVGGDAASWLDVACAGELAGQRRRFRVKGEQWRSLDTDEVFDEIGPGERPPAYADWDERDRVALRLAEESDDDAGDELVLLVAPRQAADDVDDGISARVPVRLSDHQQRVAELVQQVAGRLDLEPSIAEALRLAALWHDAGKAHPLWQFMARNEHYPDQEDAGAAWAKSPRYLHGRVLGGYRHELGSVLRAGGCEQIRAHPLGDLVIHLIASHHGWARPHFEARSADNSRPLHESHQATQETLRRFAHLQRQYGHWGLAWLEALLKCADAWASCEESQRAGSSTGVACAAEEG